MSNMSKKKWTPPPPPPPAPWTPEMGQDRIVIVTEDRDFDKRVRAALKCEGYAFVTVDDFAAHESKLTETCLGIVDARANEWPQSLIYIRRSPWGHYPLLGILAARDSTDKRDIIIHCFGPEFDMTLHEPFHPWEVLAFVKRLIQSSRGEVDDFLRI